MRIEETKQNGEEEEKVRSTHELSKINETNYRYDKGKAQKTPSTQR